MSGTSLDGISAAAARFTANGASAIDCELLAYRSEPYNAAQRARLAAAMTGSTPAEYCRLNFDLGEWLASAADKVLDDAKIEKSDVLAIASHGQTIWHEPGHSTWQAGEAAMIAERTGIDVISEFRVRDVAAGGPGGPPLSLARAPSFSSPPALCRHLNA